MKLIEALKANKGIAYYEATNTIIASFTGCSIRFYCGNLSCWIDESLLASDNWLIYDPVVLTPQKAFQALLEGKTLFNPNTYEKICLGEIDAKSTETWRIYHETA